MNNLAFLNVFLHFQKNCKGCKNMCAAWSYDTVLSDTAEKLAKARRSIWMVHVHHLNACSFYGLWLWPHGVSKKKPVHFLDSLCTSEWVGRESIVTEIAENSANEFYVVLLA